MRIRTDKSTPTELTGWSATALASAIRQRQVSIREVTAAFLDRIASRNSQHNALVSLRDPEIVLREAFEKDEHLADGRETGPLFGLPLAVKDLALTAGIATTFGSPIFADFVPDADCLVVEREKDAGCIIIGKSNVPEFGLGSHTFNPVFGTTTNAYDATRCAGGSSGGAAVALATSMVPLADGSDYMGSLRNPAAFNNVFGLRPSQGRVPSFPSVESFVSQLATEGPMGRTVADVALLLGVQSGYDKRAPLSISASLGGARLDAFGKSGPAVRIGWLGDLNGYLPMEPGVVAVCAQALQRFEGLGARIDPVRLPISPAQVWEAWLTWRHWLVGAGMATHIAAGRRHLLKPEAQWEFDQSRGLSAHDVALASQTRTSLYQSIVGLFDRFDVLALPSAQVFPFPAQLRWPESINGVSMDTYHRWMEVVTYATFAGLPAMSVPAGFGPAGLPMGLQLIGPPQGDTALLHVGAVYETTIDMLGVGLA